MIKLLTQKEQIRFFKKLKKFLNFNKKKLLIFNNLFTLLKKKVILNYSIEDNFYRVKFFVINFSNRHNSFRRLKR